MSKVFMLRKCCTNEDLKKSFGNGEEHEYIFSTGSCVIGFKRISKDDNDSPFAVSIKDMKDVLTEVSTFTNIPENEIKGKRRDRNLVEARILYTVACLRLGLSTTNTGKYIRRDHTTILHYSKTAKDLLRVDKPFIRKYESFMTFLNDKL